ncbi:MAG TPA: 30S ribosomal protein S8 [Steroidobacteraceae bacterium]|nr:30S ribosomal protein S8 [Steroidobacteraceae bacterium]
MNVTDPIADMLTRIRNASAARHKELTLPSSRVKREIARILADEGFIESYETLSTPESVQEQLVLRLKYVEGKTPVVTGLKRISKPGLRVYARKTEIPRVLGGLGLAILSTSHGIMTGSEARKQNLGGEVLCYVW